MQPRITHDIRKLTITGGSTYYVTIPQSMIRELGWRKGQKLVVRRDGERVVLEDWEG
ncbi:MAG: AbrB/MazE/SpoVT family DNA-binding domain-containing protein [Candidatus Omnitrophota bacterium]